MSLDNFTDNSATLDRFENTQNENTTSVQDTPRKNNSSQSVDTRILGRAQKLIKSLKDALDAETKALKEADLKTAIEYQDVKIKLMSEYETLIEDAKQNAEALKNSQSAEKKEIASLKAGLNQSIENNKRALNNSKRAVERLTTRILDTVRKCVQSEDNQSYGASGTINNSSRSLSINVDKTL